MRRYKVRTDNTGCLPPGPVTVEILEGRRVGDWFTYTRSSDPEGRTHGCPFRDTGETTDEAIRAAMDLMRRREREAEDALDRVLEEREKVALAFTSQDFLVE